MKLIDRLTEYTKDELFAIAENYNIKVNKSLKKADLVQAIAEGMSDPDIMYQRLVCLTDEEVSLLKKAIHAPKEIGINDIGNAMQLYMYLLGEFEEETDRLAIYDEIKEVYSKIEDKEYLAEQKKKGWLIKCIRFFREYYGIAPLEVIHKLYRLKEKDDIADMLDMIWEIPIDMIGSCVLPEDEFQLDIRNEDEQLHTEGGLLVNIDMLEDGDIFPLLSAQRGKDFYIPSVSQINEILRDCYESSAIAYKKLYTFFKRNLNMEHEVAQTWCLNVWMNSYEGNNPSEIINKLNEKDVIFDGDNEIREFMDLIMNAYNNTRLIENRGHKPIELRPKKFEGMPTIVPGSSKAAAILSELQPKLSAMGIPVELGKKVYPNDPCPCGSGKKYKKCCGR